MVVESERASVEMQSNVLLKAIQPGGILYAHIEPGPLKVLCCPQQSFLEASGLMPYLLLPPASQLPSSPLQKASSSCFSSSATACPVTFTLDGRRVILTPEEHQQVAQILCKEFLDFHTLRFDDVASPVFMTARGHRGEFSGNLESVARYGRIGTATVLCDLSLVMKNDTATVPDHHLCKLHVFIIAAPLMDEEEAHNTLSALKRAASPAVRPSKEIRCEMNTPHSGSLADVSAPDSHYTREFIANYRQAVADDNDVRFPEFQRCMELSVCAPIAMALSNFVGTMQQREVPMLDDTDVKRASIFFMDKCRKLSLFSRDPTKLHIAAEGFERYIMTKLYWCAFGVDPEEQNCNKVLNGKLRRLSVVITAEQLDAIGSVEDHPLWKEAMSDLNGMNFFKSPRDKLRCGVRASQKLSQAISDTLLAPDKKAGDGNHSREKNPVVFGACELLPCFMLLVLRSYPWNFYLNVQYVKRFRSVDLMTSEESYCLTNLESAATFWLAYVESPVLCDKHPTPSSVTIEDPVLPAATPEPMVWEERNGLHEASLPEGKTAAEESSIVCDPVLLLERSANNSVGESGESGINVERLLLDEETPFDNLTVAELRAIVSEARRLMRLRRESPSAARDVSP